MDTTELQVARVVPPVEIDLVDRAALVQALAVLDGGAGLLVRVAEVMGGAMGRTVWRGARRLELAAGVEGGGQAVAARALRLAFDVAVRGLGEGAGEGGVSRGKASRAVVVMSGAVGGFFGLGGFVPDATLTTLTIMRDIARVAQEAGESLSDEDTRRACLEVFALTPGDAGDGQLELGYLSARLFMRGRPLKVLLSELAGRYGVSLSQKFVMQAVPVAGAFGGAALNSAFLSRYRNAARAHFKVRELERRYGQALIEKEVLALRGGAEAFGG